MYELDLGLEAISFQSRAFGNAITDEVRTLRKLAKMDNRDLKDSNLSKLVKKYTNLDVTFTYISYMTAAVSSDLFQVGTDFIKTFTKFDSDPSLLSKSGIDEFGIDLRYGLITKMPKNIKTTIYINDEMMHALDADEMAAVILHEIGHIVSLVAMMSRFVTTNYFLSDFANELLDLKDEKLRIALIENDELASKYLKHNKKELASASNIEATTLIILNSEVGRSRSDFGNNVYDVRGCEALADQYVSRMGYGLELTRAIGKFQEHSKGWYIYNSVLVTIGMILNPVYFVVSSVFLATVAIGTIAIPDTYDKPKDRVMAIRNDMVKRLKGAKGPEVKEIIKQLDSIDFDVFDDGILHVDILTFILSLLIPVFRSNKKTINIQKALEQLSASQLNVTKAKLKQLV